jgi:type IV pilus assembly protein PilE
MLGVTLLELLAVITIIGILGAIAVPGYRQYVLRAQRTEAKTALLQLATNQERFYLANRTYGSVLQLQNANLLAGSGGNAFSERGLYQITIASPDRVTYTATATPVAGGAVDMREDTRCATFSITAQGLRTATGSDAANCW